MLGQIKSVGFGSRSTALPLPTRSVQELVLSDGLCPRIKELGQGMASEQVAITATDAPLQAITAALDTHHGGGGPLDTLHLVAHGRPGAFHLGGQWVDAEALLAGAALLAQWQVRRIALWSCHLGQDPDFLTVLAELSGAEIWSTAASLDNRTGWTIAPARFRTLPGEALSEGEGRCGEAIAAPFDPAHRAAWPHTLGKVYAAFAEVFSATSNGGSSYLLESEIIGNNINFSQEDPFTLGGETKPDGLFEDGAKGNSIPGTLSYLPLGASTPTELVGVIEQVRKEQGQPEAFVFIELNSVGAPVAYYWLSIDENRYVPGQSYGTSQDSPLAALNQVALPPLITLAVAPDSVLEDGAINLDYTFSRTGDTTDPLTVTYTVAGTATNGTDYGSVGTTVTFAAGSSTATVTVDPIPDATVEADETVSLTLQSGTEYTVGTPEAVTGTILNDDVSQPSISVTKTFTGVSGGNGNSLADAAGDVLNYTITVTNTGDVFFPTTFLRDDLTDFTTTIGGLGVCCP